MLQRISLLLLALLLVTTGCKKKKEDPANTNDDANVEATEDAPTDAEDADNDADTPAQAEVQRETQRWFIFEEKVACGGDDSEECFRIRRAGNPEWEVVEGDIQGFEYADGTRYILEVDVLTRTEQSEEDADGDDAAAKAEPEVIVVGYELVRQVSPLPPGEEEPTCTSNDDCEEDEMCAGPAGCDVPWTCKPMRPCTRDLRQYCSCEGETIEGSGSCPPAPYKHPGPCK